MRARVGYLVGGLTLVGGFAIAALIFFQQFQGLADQLQQVVVPGEHEIALAQGGAHTIFHEQRALVVGRYFASDRQLNGLRLRLQSMPASEDVEIDPPSARTSYSFADREGSSIATFEVPHPGTYRLSAWYPEPATATTAVLAIGQGVERRLMTAIFGALGSLLGGLMACVGIAIATYRRNKRNQRTHRTARLGGEFDAE